MIGNKGWEFWVYKEREQQHKAPQWGVGLSKHGQKGSKEEWGRNTSKADKAQTLSSLQSCGETFVFYYGDGKPPKCFSREQAGSNEGFEETLASEDLAQRDPL